MLARRRSTHKSRLIETMDRESPLPVFYQVAEALKRRLQSPQYRAGDRFVGVRDVVTDYGVSFVTAQRALKRLADERAVRSERGRGTIVLRKPRSAGRAKLRTSTKRIVFLWLTHLPACRALQDQAFTLVQGMRAELPPGYCISLDFADEMLLEEDAADYFESVVSNEQNAACCLLLAPHYVKRFFERAKLPTVVLGNIEPDIHLSFVGSDEESAQYDLTRSLIDRGHRRFMRVMGAPRTIGHEEGLRGFRRALAEVNGVEAAQREELALTVPFDRELAIERFISAARAIEPTAVICSGSLLAGWLRPAAGKNVHFAYDIFDRGHENLVAPATLLKWPGDEMGRTAARLLKQQWAGERNVKGRTFKYTAIEELSA